MADYSKMKVAELQAVLKERGLPSSGKKDELIARLNDADSKSKAAATTTPSTTTANGTAAAKPTEAMSTSTTAAPSASSKSQPANAGAVDSSTEDKLATAPTGESSAPQVSNDAAAAPTTTANPDDAAANGVAKPLQDFSSGLEATSLDDEIARRRARYEKFKQNNTDGQNEAALEGIQQLERQKKFGAIEQSAPKGLDEALPEKSRKRGRDDGDDEDRRKKGRRGGGFRGRPRHQGRRTERDTREQGKANSDYPGWMNTEDKAAAEARKKRFAAPTA